jgi:sulfate adenylyltransferase subunit 1
MNNAIAQQIAEQGGVEAYLHAQQHKSPDLWQRG